MSHLLIANIRLVSSALLSLLTHLTTVYFLLQYDIYHICVCSIPAAQSLLPYSPRILRAVFVRFTQWADFGMTGQLTFSTFSSKLGDEENTHRR